MYKLIADYANNVVAHLNDLRDDYEVEVIETTFEGAKYMRCLVYLTAKVAPAVKAIPKPAIPAKKV